MCGAIVGPGCGAWEEINSWTIDIPAKERETAGRAEGPRGEPLRYEEDQGSRLDMFLCRVLHITDIHLDLTYTLGNEAQCDLPMCCGNTSGEQGHVGTWTRGDTWQPVQCTRGDT